DRQLDGHLADARPGAGALLLAELVDQLLARPVVVRFNEELGAAALLLGLGTLLALLGALVALRVALVATGDVAGALLLGVAVVLVVRNVNHGRRGLFVELLEGLLRRQVALLERLGEAGDRLLRDRLLLLRLGRLGRDLRLQRRW